MSDEALRRIRAAADAAYQAGQYRRSAELAHAGVEAAGGNLRWRVWFLFWEGESLACAGDLDAALPPLLEAIASDGPGVDLADTFNARTTLIDIARIRKNATYTRRVLGESLAWLKRAGREGWAHKLDRLEADREAARGDWPAALRADLRGWERYSDKYPSFTRATHLWGLCKAAFGTRDMEALSRWSELLRENRTKVEGDRVYAGLGSLLAARALAGGRRLEPVAVEEARATLRRASGTDDSDSYVRVHCARVLALGGCFTEAETALAIPTPTRANDRFWLMLCRADISLQRARDALGQEPLDDEWLDVPPEPPSSGGDAREAITHIDAAERTCASITADAHTEDERLETTYHARTLADRRERVTRLREAARSRPGGSS